MQPPSIGVRKKYIYNINCHIGEKIIKRYKIRYNWVVRILRARAVQPLRVNRRKQGSLHWIYSTYIYMYMLFFVRVPLVRYYIVRAVKVNINNVFLKKKIIHGPGMKVKYNIKKPGGRGECDGKISIFFELSWAYWSLRVHYYDHPV